MDFISPWIHTTEKCNLKCHYCYVRGKEVMSPKIYEALYALLLEAPTNNRHLRFAGGEPMLTFDIWESFARSMLKHEGTTVEVLTNFYIVPRDFWKFAELENVSVSVSIDNGKKVKRLNKNIAEKISRLRNPWIMTTVTKENIERLDLMAAFIGMNNYGWAITTDYFEKTMPAWEDLAVEMLNIVEILKELNYDFTRISFNNFSIKSGFSGCCAGNEMFAVACNGNIHKCQTLIGKPKIGDVFSGYKHSNPCVKKECKVCSIYGLCKGWCPLYYKTPNPVCNVIKLFAEKILKEANNA